MAILDFIKSIFKKEAEEETKAETVLINELPGWIKNKSESISNELNDKLNLIKDKIKQELQSTKDNLKKLESAELRNKNISIREKQFMEGNREAYIKKISIFIDRILVPDNPKEILAKCTNFDKELQYLGKSTARPYHILQEFFGNESKDVAINIKNLDKYMKDLTETIKNFGLDKIEKIKADIEHLIKAIAQKDKYISEIKQVQGNLEALKNSKNKIEEEIITFKKSDEFLAYERLKSDKTGAVSALEEHKKLLFHSFAVLERALKKFQRIVFENENLVESYMQNPIIALQNDRELKIIDILRKLEENVEGNKLDLKDKKKDKTLDEIKKLNQEFFVYFLNKYRELENKLDEINKQIEANDVENKIEELNKTMEKTNADIETNNKNMDYLKKELEKIDVEKLKSNLVKEIKNAINIEVTLS